MCAERPCDENAGKVRMDAIRADDVARNAPQYTSKRKDGKPRGKYTLEFKLVKKSELHRNPIKLIIGIELVRI